MNRRDVLKACAAVLIPTPVVAALMPAAKAATYTVTYMVRCVDDRYEYLATRTWECSNLDLKAIRLTEDMVEASAVAKENGWQVKQTYRLMWSD